MSKNNRDRQGRGRGKIPRWRAEEARRRGRRFWLIGAGAAVILIAAVVGITLAVTGGSPKAAGVAAPKLNLAPLSTLGTLKPAPAPGQLGPEGVPVPAGPALAGIATAAPGQAVDGISGQATQQTHF